MVTKASFLFYLNPCLKYKYIKYTIEKKRVYTVTIFITNSKTKYNTIHKNIIYYRKNTGGQLLFKHPISTVLRNINDTLENGKNRRKHNSVGSELGARGHSFPHCQ